MGDGQALYELMDTENVTASLGVPTVWLALLKYCRESGKRLDKMQRTIAGGAAVPRSMIKEFRDVHGVEVRQGWGMTEMSPLGVTNTVKAGLGHLSDDEQLDLAAKAGRGIFGCELRIVNDAGEELPWDGEAYGALQVRGPWICSDYFKLNGTAGAHTADGWFDTGDVATIDAEGFMAITDRTKDVIKSGGEWISSAAIEGAAMGHPAVALAAVIGIPHPRWQERPLLVVVRRPEKQVTAPELIEFLKPRMASWWLPTDVTFVETLPLTATGKVHKVTLRQQFKDYVSVAAA
jgi:fatty-acyl-CoA synthase